jgi:hypothetical protein
MSGILVSIEGAAGANQPAALVFVGSRYLVA